MRVPWTSRRLIQSILREINPEAEGPVLWPLDAKSRLIGKDLDAGKMERQRRRGHQRIRCLDSITSSMDMNLSELWAWCSPWSCRVIVFDWENAIALHAMQGNRASSRGEGEISWVFSSSAGTWGIFSSYDRDAHSKREFV